MKMSMVDGAKQALPVGVACGDGVIDWAKVIEILRPLDREIVLSVECGTIEQAEKSFHYLTKLIG